MSGNTTAPKFEYPLIFDIRTNAPIDSRYTIDSIAAVTTQIPESVRYPGLFVWVEEEKTYYHFKNGITYDDFVPFTFSNGAVKFVYTSTNVIVNNDILSHNLETKNLIIEFYLNDKKISVDWRIADPDVNDDTFELNNIQFTLPDGLEIPAGLKAVIHY